MADAGQKTTPPPADGLAHVNTDGTVTASDDTWVWCQDPGTGGRFDVHVRALPQEGVVVVEGYPLHRGPVGRAPKARVVWAQDGETDLPGEPEQQAPEAAVSGNARRRSGAVNEQ